jgi:peptidoglycan/LPS O-acetylase OafA/YrhL
MSSERTTVGLFKNKGLVALDALRGAAALSVAIPHYFLFQGLKSPVLEFISIMAVEVFFVLSGFVLARQLIQCVNSRLWRDVITFYMRRWMRTLPPFLVVLILLAAATGQLFGTEFWKYALFIRNFVVISSNNDFFMPAWSLAVEEWFYVLFPLFLITLRRCGLSILISAFVFIGLLLAAKVAYLLIAPDLFTVARRIVVVRLDAIAFGFVLAVVAPALMARRESALIALLVLCATSLAACVWATREHYVFVFLYVAPAFAVTVIGLTFLNERAVAGNRMIAKAASFGANTSYMIYLVHTLLIIRLASLRNLIEPSLHFAIYVALLFSICAIFFVTIEASILRARPRYGSAPSGLAPTPTHGPLAAHARRPIARIMLANLIAAVAFSYVVEGGAWIIKHIYMSVRNAYADALGVSPIEQQARVADSSDPASTYSSSAVRRDISLNDSMPGSAYRYESYIVYQNRPFASEHVNIAVNGMRLNRKVDPAPARPRDVWIFGSSPVFGATNADDETIPAAAERAYRRLLGRESIAVANFGVVGYTALQDMLNFQRRLSELPKPALAIFINGHNDHHLAWLSEDEDCNKLFETGVGSSHVLSESWEIRARGGAVILPAVLEKLRAHFSNTLELSRFIDKFIALRIADADMAAWRERYRAKRDEENAIGEACTRREQASYLRVMRQVASLAAGEGVKVVFVHQPILYTSAKPQVGVEQQEIRHLDEAFFALSDQELNGLETVPTYRLDQHSLWEKSRYTRTYAEQKMALRKLAGELRVPFIDLDPVINTQGAMAVFSTSIHFTFRGAELVGGEIARRTSDLLAKSLTTP